MTYRLKRAKKGGRGRREVGGTREGSIIIYG
jgi:hypothetical protein